jgi:hypothetical protein
MFWWQSAQEVTLKMGPKPFSGVSISVKTAAAVSVAL